MTTTRASERHRHKGVATINARASERHKHKAVGKGYSRRVLQPEGAAAVSFRSFTHIVFL